MGCQHTEIHAHNQGTLVDQHNEALQLGSEIKSGTISHKKKYVNECFFSTHVLHHKTSELLPDDSVGAFYCLLFGKRYFLCRKEGHKIVLTVTKNKKTLLFYESRLVLALAHR